MKTALEQIVEIAIQQGITEIDATALEKINELKN